MIRIKTYDAKLRFTIFRVLLMNNGGQNLNGNVLHDSQNKKKTAEIISLIKFFFTRLKPKSYLQKRQCKLLETKTIHLIMLMLKDELAH